MSTLRTVEEKVLCLELASGPKLLIGGQKSQDKYDTRLKRKSAILETSSFVLDAGIFIVFQCL